MSAVSHVNSAPPGPKALPRGAALEKLGIRTQADLLEYFPRTYVRESAEREIGELSGSGTQWARGEVVAVDYVQGTRPRFVVTLSDGRLMLTVTFFNGGYLRGKLVPGTLLRVCGKVQTYRGEMQMINPRWEKIAPESERRADSVFRPIYPAGAEVTSVFIERIVKQRLDSILAEAPEWFSPELLKRRKLPGRREAYRAIHSPVNEVEARNARRRLVYDELMLLQLALGISKRQQQVLGTAPMIHIDKLLDERIRRRLSFKLTGAQERVISQIAGDFRSGLPMNRLLQGDVGSGKTAVAVYAMLAAVANKMQAAILAPTEILAEQHYLTMGNMLAGSSVEIGLFTSRTNQRARQARRAALAAGRIHLAIGTQALLEEDVEFAELGLVVIDEQHRLGVMQRRDLRDKARKPHYLVMTATPIPRTLALSYLADFEVSVIDELPPGRRPVKTRWLRANQSAKAYEFIREQAGLGRQIYVVVPQVEEGDDGVKSVLQETERLRAGPLAGLRIESLHGKMTPQKKQEVMNALRDGRLDVLVATTVIEVGIDVPNAAVIVIDQAERFGLAQLHQLRGRVGRGTVESHCILLSDASSPAAEARLEALVKTQSGFQIAEMDLQLRGPGEFFGARQHGLPQFKLADLQNELPLLAQAKEDAMGLLKEDPHLNQAVHQHLRGALLKQFGKTLNLAQVV